MAGLLAQWVPAPTAVPYLPHIALMAIVLASLRAAPQTVAESSRGIPRLSGLDSAVRVFAP